ncbi:hypothetical protein FB45DRAFT_795437 [Roridomyces roridus]|uniref:Asl1-like glycosyl hydrolase catalytic domain-containing protein n=1 Tax=Roridomyces roridus TaxID=1738132 RepID=A0AAD7BQB4_9AGAR|nr:hypothetical protein FB45DRAFT_795437 [Roridomyces roridus]
MKTSATLLFSALAVASVSATPLNNTARSGPGKRGLAWPFYNAPLNPGAMNTNPGTVNLIYDYETFSPPSTKGAGGLAFIGMQRCLDCTSSPIAQLKARQQQLGFVTVFTLNEPDINGITPQQAAQWYIQNINPLAIKKALPAVTSSATAGQGLDWVAQMITACAGQCFFDYINLHHYGSSFAQFQNYVNAAHARFPQFQIVITEFALQNPPGGQADQIAFYKQAIPFLDSASFVEMYFPFVATSPALLSANDPAAVSFVGTGSTLYNNDGTVSAVGKLFMQ